MHILFESLHQVLFLTENVFKECMSYYCIFTII